MASNTIKGLTVEIGGDTTKLGKALQNVEKQSRSLSSELGQINKLLKLDPGNTELLAQKQKVLASAISATAEKLATLKAAEAQVQEQFEKGEASEEQVRALQREIIQTENKLNSYEKAARETAEEIDGLGKNSEDAAKHTDDLGDSMDDASSATSEVGRNLNTAQTMLAGLIANLASKAIEEGISKLKDAAQAALEVGRAYEDSMAEVAAISGATGDDLALLEETARKFGAETVFSASEAADALKYMALAGWDTQQSVSALPGILNLAAASGMELASASDMVTDYLSAFSMEASEAEYFADMLAYAQSNANTTAEQLGEAYKNCAANLNAAGQDVETVTSLLSMMANQGLKSSEAGTALNAIMRDITNSMKDGAIAIGDTNVQVMDADGNYRDLTDILKDVDDATEGMGDAQKAAALAATFTSDSTKGLNLILNEGVDSAEDFEDALHSCSGTAEKMSDTMNDTLTGDIKEMESAWEELGITVYEDFEETLRGAVKYVTNTVVPKLTNLSKAISTDGKTIKASIAGITTALGICTAAVIAASIANGTLAAAIGRTTAAQVLYNAAVTLTPWGVAAVAISAAIIALGVYAATLEETEKEFTVLTEAEQEQIETAHAAADAWREESEAAAESANASLNQIDHVQALADELQTLADANGVVADADKERAQYILGELNDALGTEYTMTGNVIDQYDSLKDTIYATIEAKKADTLLEAYNEDYVTAIKNQADAWTALKNAQDDYDATSEAHAQALANKEAAEKVYADALAANQQAAIEGYHAYSDAEMQAMSQEVSDAAASAAALETAKEEKKATFDNAAADYYEYSTTIQNYEAAESAALQGNYNAAVDLLNKKTQAVADNSDATSDYIDTNIYHLGQESAKVDAETKKQLETLRQKAIDAGIEAENTRTNFENGIEGFTMAMADEAEQGYQDAMDAYSNAYSDAYSAGNNMGSGFDSGLGSWASTLKSTARNMVEKAVAAAKSAMKIKSPSRVTMEIGKYMGEGVAVGIDNTDEDVQKSAVKQVQGAVSAYQQENLRGQQTMSAVNRAASTTRLAQTMAGNESLLSGMQEILSAIRSGQTILLDGKTLVGKTAAAMDSELGRRHSMVLRGNA